MLITPAIASETIVQMHHLLRYLRVLMQLMEYYLISTKKAVSISNLQKGETKCERPLYKYKRGICAQTS